MKTEAVKTSASRLPEQRRAATDRAGNSAARIHLRNILVPVDFSELSYKSLQYAIPLAQQFGGKLTLLYVLEPLAYTPELPYGIPLPPDPANEIRRTLQNVREERIPEDVAVDILVQQDFAHCGVVEAARAVCADLIIATTHGRTGVKHLLMGSTVEKIVRHAPCPVLVLSDPEHEFI
jgi:nucleotide-binding universal stress UspA family protein